MKNPDAISNQPHPNYHSFDFLGFFRRQSLSTKLTLAYSVLIAAVSIALAFRLYAYLYNAQRADFQERLSDILSFSAPLVDGDFHSLIRNPGDTRTAFYRVVLARLRGIQSTSSIIRHIYTLRQQQDGSWVYVVDAFASNPAQVNQPYPFPVPDINNSPAIGSSIETDANGPYLRGFAPIYDQFHSLDGVLVIEVDATSVESNERQTIFLALGAFVTAAPIAMILGWLLSKRLTYPLLDLTQGARRVSQGNLNQPVAVQSLDEIGVLATTFNSMTARLRQSLDDIRESEERLRTLINATPDIVCFKDGEGRWLEANESILHLYRLEDVNYQGCRDSDLAYFTPTCQEVLLECEKTDEIAWQKGGPLRVDEAIPISTDESRVYDIIKIPLFHVDGSRKALVMLGRDVSERRQVEEELRRSEIKYRATFENSGTPLILVDEDMTILMVNREWERISGYKREDVENKRRWSEFISNKSNLEMTMEYHAKCMGDPDFVPRTYETSVTDQDGQMHDVVATVAVIPQTRRCLVAILDITERLRVEAAIAESENLYRTIFENTGTATVIIGGDSTIELANTGFQELSGYSRQELEGEKNFFEFVSQIDVEKMSRYHNLRRQDPQAAPRTYEFHFIDRNGQVKDCIKMTTMIPGSLKSVASIIDMTERKQAEEQIQRQVQRLAALRTVDMTISGSLDLRVTLDVLLDQVLMQLHVDAADILLLDSHTHTLTYAAERGFQGMGIRKSTLRLGDGYAGRAALENRIVFIEDLPRSEQFLRNPMVASEGFMVYCGIPLVAKGQVKGVLEVFHRSLLKQDPEWLSFLETMAGQAAIAIDNSTLFENLQRSNTELALAYDATIEGWSRALDMRDKETEGHTQRVTEMTLELASALGMSKEELTNIRRGALLHDIGKMGISDRILLKNGPLDDEERAIMNKHPVFAYELLSPISYMRLALNIPFCHHERWDGTGYPRGLKGDQTPLAARIFAVVDVYDALRSDRPYRRAWPEDKVREYILHQSGKQFDPQVVTLFMDFLTKNKSLI